MNVSIPFTCTPGITKEFGTDSCLSENLECRLVFSVFSFLHAKSFVRTVDQRPDVGAINVSVQKNILMHSEGVSMPRKKIRLLSILSFRMTEAILSSLSGNLTLAKMKLTGHGSHSLALIIVCYK